MFRCEALELLFYSYIMRLLGIRMFLAPPPTKIWRIRFLGSNSTHNYRHDIIHYKLTKFYTGFRLIVVSLDKNVCARVDNRLNIFRAFSPAALPHPAASIELIIACYATYTNLFHTGY
jgi:hypothetical protein